MAGLLDADSGAALVAGLFAAGEVSGLPGAAEISVEGHADRLPDCAAVTVHVRPGAALTAVGGRHGDALVVCLTGRPAGVAATQAVLRAVAEAFGVPGRDVALVTGATSRDKVIEIAGPPAPLTRRLGQLLDT